MLKYISRSLLSVLGWEIDYTDPGIDKYVLIGAPHTSNWDFPLSLIALSAIGIKCNWVAKHTIFRWPFGMFFRAIGGIPVDRSTGTGFLKRILSAYRKRERMILVIAPEGTRSKTAAWKTGFYTIDVKAGVPIVPGYVDYSKKRLGIGEKIVPTGDIEHDFGRVAEFYQGKQGLYPERQGNICFKDQTTRS